MTFIFFQSWGIEIRVSGILGKCTATEDTYPGIEHVNAEREIYIQLILSAFDLLWDISKQK